MRSNLINFLSLFGFFFEVCDFQVARHGDYREMTEEFLLHLLFREKERFLPQVGGCALFWGSFGERSNKTFITVERDSIDV